MDGLPFFYVLLGSFFFSSSIKQYTVCRMFLNIHYDPYHCTVGHRYTVVLLLLLSKIQFFFPPALLDSKAKMLTIFFCSWPWSCDSSSRPVTDWMRLLKVDTMMDWMFHVKLSCIVYLPTISCLSWKCDELRSHVQFFSRSVVQFFNSVINLKRELCEYVDMLICCKQ